MDRSRLQLQLLLVIALLALPLGAIAQTPDQMKAIAKTGLQWTPLEVPGFAPGIKLAAMVGDPAVADQPYVLRLSFPDGYRFPPHFHPKTENVTVLSGTFLLAMGKTADENLKTYAPGDFLWIPAEMPHYGGAKGETVVQLHGIGPFEIKLVTPPKSGPNSR